MAMPASGPQAAFDFPGKHPQLALLGNAPLVAETPESLLDDDTTPTEKLFIRNNGRIPAQIVDPAAWRLRVDGEVERPLQLSLADLQARFEPVTRRVVLECGGNGRAFFAPAAQGNPWTNGGVGCPEWTGVRLADVLAAAGVKPSATFTGHFGADGASDDNPKLQAMSRGVPIAKALDENNLIAWAVNGEPLPLIHGFPLRLIIAGWPGSVSSKWLTRIWVRDRVHDGKGMGGASYRVPIRPVAPGEQPSDDNLRDLESMPVRSIITSPAGGARLAPGARSVHLRGAAWAGDDEVSRVDLSIDAGSTWHPATLKPARNRYDWRRWTATLPLPGAGYFRVWCRATDSRGVMQPHTADNWNPQGYGANPMHHIAIVAT